MRSILPIILGILMLSVFSFGCVAQETNETKLEVTEGIGIVGSLKIEELNPGLYGYVSLVVRNNLGGSEAYNVIVTLDNLPPFKVFECGDVQEPDTVRKDVGCSGEFDLDSNLPFMSHGIQKLFPGQEVEVFWRIKAPDEDEISRIALKHPIYYVLQYTYKTSFHQNVIFMSRTELLKRQQAGEETKIEGEASMSAGELRISGKTEQPIVYQSFSGEAQEFPFALRFDVENLGDGYPISDLALLFEFPDGIEYDSVAKDYGWYKLTEAEQPICDTAYEGEKTCKEWILDSFGDYRSYIENNGDRFMIKRIDKSDFVDEFSIYVPLKISKDEMSKLKSIPMKIYTFKMYIVYRYFTEGKDYIYVYPIKAY